ncbi:hypothetical protein TorRG33x02_280150, partial [Trema orientale]
MKNTSRTSMSDSKSESVTNENIITTVIVIMHGEIVKITSYMVTGSRVNKPIGVAMVQGGVVNCRRGVGVLKLILKSMTITSYVTALVTELTNERRLIWAG